MQIIEEYVDAHGHGTVGIQLFAHAVHGAEELYALLLPRFGDLVSQRIHYHAGVVVVLDDHVRDVAFVPLGHVVGIVVHGLVYVPHVDVFVHHHDAEAVAGAEHGFGAGIVRAAHGVVARFSEQPYLALLRLFVAPRAENAVVVMYARAADNDALAVYAEAGYRVAFDLAHAEGLDGLVVAEARRAGIQRGAVGRPEFGVRNFGGEYRFGSALSRQLGDNPAAARYRHRHLARLARRHLYFDHRRFYFQRAYAYAAERYALFRLHVHGHGAVYARARVPTAVGLIGVAGDDAHLVRLPEAQEVLRGHVKIRIAVRPVHGLFAVYVHFGVAVHAFELERNRHALVSRGHFESLHVFVVVPLEPARVGAAVAVYRARLAYHGVVRQVGLRPLSAVHAFPFPA